MEKIVKLYHDDVYICEVLTNHSMSVEDVLNLMEIDMNAFAAKQGWDDWNPGLMWTKY